MPQNNEQYGYVYVLKNEYMPGLIKIGITDNLDERMRTLYNTSVPVAFEVVYACKVHYCDCRKIEGALHNAFCTDRVNPKREFFKMEASRAVGILRLFSIEEVTEEANADIRAELSPSELEAQTRAVVNRENIEQEQRKKRPTLNYYDLGINNGERLYWKDNSNIYVIVSGERKVFYENELCSLTFVTQKIKGTEKPIAPAPYWVYEGKLLIDIYNEKYQPEDSTE